MRILVKSGGYVEVHPLKLIWMKAKLFLSRKAREDMDAAVASLTYIEHLQEIDQIREKAEAHSALIEEIVASQPEIVVMETTFEEYDEVADNKTAVVENVHHALTDLGDDKPTGHTDTLVMESVEWNPKVLDELYDVDVDNIEDRIVLETAETNERLKKEGWGE